jgi:hypothetical protein
MPKKAQKPNKTRPLQQPGVGCVYHLLGPPARAAARARGRTPNAKSYVIASKLCRNPEEISLAMDSSSESAPGAVVHCGEPWRPSPPAPGRDILIHRVPLRLADQVGCFEIDQSVAKALQALIVEPFD